MGIQTEPRGSHGASARFWWIAAAFIVAAAVISRHWLRSFARPPEHSAIAFEHFPDVRDRTPPWDARPDRSPPVGKGYIPAWKIDPPRGNPNARSEVDESCTG